eukprot:gene1015-2617_t
MERLLGVLDRKWLPGLAFAAPVAMFLTNITLTYATDVYFGYDSSNRGYPYISDTGREGANYVVFVAGSVVSALLWWTVLTVHVRPPSAAVFPDLSGPTSMAENSLSALVCMSAADAWLNPWGTALALRSASGLCNALLPGCPFIPGDSCCGPQPEHWACDSGVAAVQGMSSNPPFANISNLLVLLRCAEEHPSLSPASVNIPSPLQAVCAGVFAVFVIIYIPVLLPVACYERLTMEQSTPSPAAVTLAIHGGSHLHPFSCTTLRSVEYCDDHYLKDSSGGVPLTRLWDYEPCRGLNTGRAVSQHVAVLCILLYQ